jgi:TolB protein
MVNNDGSGAVKIIDTPDRVSLDGAPDGSQIVYASKKDGNWDIYIVGADGSGAKKLTNDPAADWLPAWSPDGRAIAFVSNRDGNWAIWVMAADGTNQRKLFDVPGPPDGVVRDEPAWSSMGWIEERISWAP